MKRKKFTNLFTRLSRYACKPKNVPLENFCTELLAWYLVNSRDFCLKFLVLTTGPSALSNYDLTQRVEADTQRHFQIAPKGQVLRDGEKPKERGDENQTVIPDM